MNEILEGEEEQASRLIDDRDELIKLRRDNRRLQIYRKAIHGIADGVYNVSKAGRRLV